MIFQIKKHIILSAIIAITGFSSAIPLASQEFKESDVKNLISGAESMLATAVTQGAPNYASQEINIINEYISKSKNLLKQKKISEAYYEIMIGVEYFRVIESKRLLHNLTGGKKEPVK